MITVNNLYDSIGLSHLTLIGYSYKFENQLDSFLNNLNPIMIDDQIITNADIGPFITALVRDSKIETLINSLNFNTNLIVIDMTNINVERNDISHPKTRYIENFLKKLREYSISSNYKFIITCPVYTTYNSNGSVPAFAGGSSPLYMSDLVLLFSEKIKVIKNRIGNDNYSIDYDQLEIIPYI